MSVEPGPPAPDPVDAALARLDTLGDVPLREHVEVFETVHAALQDHLAENED